MKDRKVLQGEGEDDGGGGTRAFARIARRVAEAVMPAYESKYSKRVFIQPQPLAVLCPMRYEDWTFREAEVRLAEHGELRAALGLARTPDYTTLHRFLRRVEETTFTRALAEAVHLSPTPPPGGAPVAATGLTDGAIGTFFVKRAREHGQDVSRRHWLKRRIVVDVPRRAVIAQLAKPGPTNDSATLRQVTPIHLVLADAEFDGERNHQHIRQVIGADSIIPA